jgi:hypothetical protein
MRWPGLPATKKLANPGLTSGLLRDRLRIDCVEAFGVIQAWDVDPSESWPDGRHCEKTKRYPSDLTDEEWERIAAF